MATVQDTQSVKQGKNAEIIQALNDGRRTAAATMAALRNALQATSASHSTQPARPSTPSSERSS
jgi:hypothetical protein